MYPMTPRLLVPNLAEVLTDTPVVYLQGPRQAGKSTLVQTLDPDRRYLSLDTAAVRSAAAADPEGFVAGLGGGGRARRGAARAGAGAGDQVRRRP